MGGGAGDGVHVPGGLPGNQVPGELPAPNQSFQGTAGPETGLVIRLNRNSGLWEDQLGRNWTNAVRFDLPDLDVFKIDAMAGTPAQTDSFAHVGTVLFNMVVHPNGKVYVSNTEARNEVRFEGPGSSAATVRGHLHETRVTVIDGSNVLPRHLNKAAIPPDGTCAGAPCWEQISFNLLYRDRELTPNGINRVQLTAPPNAAARLKVRGKGVLLPLRSLPPQGFSLPVTVQLKNSNGECWAATYTTAIKNGQTKFKARQ